MIREYRINIAFQGWLGMATNKPNIRVTFTEHLSLSTAGWLEADVAHQSTAPLFSSSHINFIPFHTIRAANLTIRSSLMILILWHPLCVFFSSFRSWRMCYLALYVLGIRPVGPLGFISGIIAVVDSGTHSNCWLLIIIAIPVGHNYPIIISINGKGRLSRRLNQDNNKADSRSILNQARKLLNGGMWRRDKRILSDSITRFNHLMVLHGPF